MELIKELSALLKIEAKGTGSDIIKHILNESPNKVIIDKFIKKNYSEKQIKPRVNLISDEDLVRELKKVNTFSWGVIQGQLDQKIQVQYVRRFVRFDDLVESVKANLYDEVTSYVICTWFNHWTTVLIEEHISQHSKVIPTLKKIKGVDIFFDGQPFDLKITYLPKDYNSFDALKNPQNLATWLYENQGEQRFGSDNRLFVILFDKNNPEESWKLKRNFELVFNKIDQFLNEESISTDDELVFSYKKKPYTTVSKILIVTN